MRRSLLGLALTVALGASGLVAASSMVDSKFELFVTKPEESVDFYGLLGFEVAHRKSYGYTTLKNASIIVALSPVPWWLPLRLARWLRYPPIGTELVFYVKELELLRSTLEAAGYGPSEIRRQSWGDRDFRVTDPDGYYVRLSEGAAIPTDRAVEYGK